MVDLAVLVYSRYWSFNNCRYFIYHKRNMVDRKERRWSQTVRFKYPTRREVLNATTRQLRKWYWCLPPPGSFYHGKHLYQRILKEHRILWSILKRLPKDYKLSYEDYTKYCRKLNENKLKRGRFGI